MRPCIAELMDRGGYQDESNSLLALAVENELSGVRSFKCETLQSLGVCLTDRCLIYVYRRRGGLGAGPPMGVRGREPPAVAKEVGVVGVAAHLISGWGIPKHQRKGRRS